MTNADCIRRMDDEQLYDFLSEWECGDIDYSVTFCDLCNEATKRGEVGNVLNLDCDGCRKHWLQRDAVDFGGLMYWKRNTTFEADTPQTETQNSNKNANVISVYDGVSEAVRCAMCSNPNKSDRGCDGACSYDEKLYERIMKAIAESVADTPQTEREGE